MSWVEKNSGVNEIDARQLTDAQFEALFSSPINLPAVRPFLERVCKKVADTASSIPSEVPRFWSSLTGV